MGLAEQRMDALERANHVRQTRKELREAVQRGQVDLRVILLWRDEPGLNDIVKTMPVGGLLRWMPKIGKQKSLMLCKAVQVTPVTALDNVTERQVQAILKLLPVRPTTGARSTT